MSEIFENDKKMTEDATSGATSSSMISTVPNPSLSPGKSRGKKSYIGTPGHSGTKAPPQPKPKKQKPTDNALDQSGTSLFGAPLKRIQNENMDHDKDSQCVPELKSALLAQKDTIKNADDDEVYDIIDKIMTRIAKSHGISGQKLHDLWVSKYKEIPDTWIMHH